MRKEIRLSGFGGQGIGLAGYILGRALCLGDGYEVVMTQSYGPEARGGASSANLVVADKPIAYPFVQLPDILVTLSQEAFTKFRPATKPETLVFIEEDLVQAPPGDYYRLPATRLAEELGRRIVANMVMLGFFAAVTDLVSREAMTSAIESTVKAKVVPLNLRAFEKGYTYQDGRAPAVQDERAPAVQDERAPAVQDERAPAAQDERAPAAQGERAAAT